MIEFITSGLLVLAAVFDYRTMRISNKFNLIALLLVVGCILFVDPSSWKLRAMIALGLALLFWIANLFGLSGGGDFKMMLWFGAGFDLHAFGVLVFGWIVLGLWGLVRLIVQKNKQWLPLAPALAVGMCLLDLWLAYGRMTNG